MYIEVRERQKTGCCKAEVLEVVLLPLRLRVQLGEHASWVVLVV